MSVEWERAADGPLILKIILPPGVDKPEAVALLREHYGPRLRLLHE